MPRTHSLTVLPLRNTPMPYDWGLPDGIDRLRGDHPAVSGRPQAELWYGTHHRAPARVVEDAEETPLPTILTRLGYMPRLPVLLKILAVGRPLSLQVHPDLPQARAAWAAEAPARAEGRVVNYADPSAKPEMICAVSERFDALAGVRPAAELRAVLERLGEAGATEFRTRGIALLTVGGADALVRWAVAEGPSLSGELSRALAGACPGTGLSPERLALLRDAARAFPGDRGLVLAPLLNQVTLHRGEVLALPARQIHSYQHGIGVELMSSSDNVLRCGFTSKRVDADELLRIGDFHSSAPRVATPVDDGAVQTFTPLPGLRLRRVEAGSTVLAVSEPTLALALGGSVRLGGRPLEPTEGQLLLPASTGTQCLAEIPAGATVFLADTGAGDQLAS